MILRNSYGALRECPGYVDQLVESAAEAQKVDEHGNWDFGIQGSGDDWVALNWSCYGVGNDPHTGTPLAVIQVRQSWKPRRNYPARVRKSYFLLGTNEDKTVFAHPVAAAVIHAAIRGEEDVVRSAQDWIFGGDYARMVRQGDLALIPVKRTTGTRDSRRTAVLEKSHRLSAGNIKRDGERIYVKNPRLIHLPGTHPAVSADGWFRLVVGKRARFWDFAAPTVD